MYEYKAFVERVIDGDTIQCHLDLGFNIFVKEKFRLAVINAPETSTPEGKEVKTLVENKLTGETVVLRVLKQDKYGRWLATVILDGQDFNQWLLDNGHAKLYGEKE
ncbi:MAG: thermonuclease family protein [Clostridium sp.]|uniref:thermonuclease family protein n=1 Tax=Clostridium sp. TaxID=1506 RepID=UPI0039EAAABC